MSTILHIPRSLGPVCSLAAAQLSTSPARGDVFALGGARQVEYSIVGSLAPAGAVTAYTIRVVTSRDAGATWQAVPSQRQGTASTAVSHTFTPSVGTPVRDVLVVTGPVGSDFIALEVTANGLGVAGDAVAATGKMVD